MNANKAIDVGKHEFSLVLHILSVIDKMQGFSCCQKTGPPGCDIQIKAVQISGILNILFDLVTDVLILMLTCTGQRNQEGMRRTNFHPKSVDIYWLRMNPYQ